MASNLLASMPHPKQSWSQHCENRDPAAGKDSLLRQKEGREFEPEVRSKDTGGLRRWVIL